MEAPCLQPLTNPMLIQHPPLPGMARNNNPSPRMLRSRSQIAFCPPYPTFSLPNNSALPRMLCPHTPNRTERALALPCELKSTVNLYRHTQTPREPQAARHPQLAAQCPACTRILPPRLRMDACCSTKLRHRTNDHDLPCMAF